MTVRVYIDGVLHELSDSFDMYIEGAKSVRVQEITVVERELHRCEVSYTVQPLLKLDQAPGSTKSPPLPWLPIHSRRRGNRIYEQIHQAAWEATANVDWFRPSLIKTYLRSHGALTAADFPVVDRWLQRMVRAGHIEAQQLGKGGKQFEYRRKS